jgi:hypothetical protein
LTGKSRITLLEGILDFIQEAIFIAKSGKFSRFEEKLSEVFSFKTKIGFFQSFGKC